MARFRLNLIIILVLATPSLAGADAWSVGVGCPGSGSQSARSGFSAAAANGFSALGFCERTPTRFTKFSLTDVEGGTPRASTLFGTHTGDVLILPPLRDTDDAPLFTVATRCPWRNRSLNWIYVRWESSDYTGGLIVGAGEYDTQTGLLVTDRYNVEGGVAYTGSVPLPGSCTSGVYQLDGQGDRSGAVYFNEYGSGVFQPENGRGIFFFPQNPVNAASDWGGRTFRGMVYNASDGDSIRLVRATADGTGTQLTIQPYSDPEAGVTDAGATAFVETLSFSSVNYPQPGMAIGTVTRTGFGAGSGRVACITKREVNVQIICSGESTYDSDRPYTLTLISEGATVLGEANPKETTPIFAKMYTPSGVSYDGTRLFVLDSFNSRVLVWNTLPSTNGQLHDYVLGQPDMRSNAGNNGGISASTFYQPTRVFSDGTRLFVADKFNHRVLIWTTMPTTNGAPADLVLGQPNMTSNTSNNGGISKGLNGPDDVYYDGTRLFVSDGLNHRVLIWTSMPTTNYQAPNLVLGQPNMSSNTANNGGVSAQSMNGPQAVYSDGTRLFVSERTNSRVLIWNSIPTVNRQAANVVLGRPSMTHSTFISGVSASKIGIPAGIAVSGGRLYIADEGFHRILIWNAIPTTNNAAANLVIGQPDLTTSGLITPVGRDDIYGPRGLSIAGGKLVVAQATGNRATIWNAVPIASGVLPDVVVGQRKWDSSSTSSVPFESPETLNNPQSVWRTGNRLIVADSGHHRVLIWNELPSENGATADIALGQPDLETFEKGSYPTTASGLAFPTSVMVDAGGKLFVADSENNRVLIWNSIPSTSGEPPNVALGQPDKVSGYSNQGTATRGMNMPTSVFSDGTRLYVADRYNNRVLIWNSIPDEDYEVPDLVLGQPNFSSTSWNNGGQSASSLADPLSVFVTGGRLFVADKGNNRVLIWNTIPTVNGQAADLVLGQPDMTSNSNNYGATTAQTLNWPSCVSSDGTRLFVCDMYNSRVLIWNTLPLASHAPADTLVGQPSLTSANWNDGGISERSVAGPLGVYSDSQLLYIADGYNYRVLVTPLP